MTSPVQQVNRELITFTISSSIIFSKHLDMGEVIGLSLSMDIILYHNKVLSCKKNLKNVEKKKISMFLIIYSYYVNNN